MTLLVILAVLWFVICLVGIAVSTKGAHESWETLRGLDGNGHSRSEPIVVLATSHMRHHLVRITVFAAWMVTSGLALYSPRPNVITISMRLLLTVAVSLIVYDAVTDRLVRKRLLTEFLTRPRGVPEHDGIRQ